jgi:hypothetical protein
VRIGYDREPKGHRDDAHDPLAHYPDLPQDRSDEMRDGRLADPAKPQGGYCDPDLANGEVGIQVPQGVVHDPGPDAPLLLQLHDARLPHPHEGELGRNEETVECHKHQGEEKVKRRE